MVPSGIACTIGYMKVYKNMKKDRIWKIIRGCHSWEQYFKRELGSVIDFEKGKCSIEYNMKW